MPNPSGPDTDDTSDAGTADRDAETTGSAGAAAEPVGQADGQASVPDEPGTDSDPGVSDDPEDATAVLSTGEAHTEVFSTEALDPESEAETSQDDPPQRRFTAPGFDAGQTEVIQSVPEPATEVMHTQQASQEEPTTAMPGPARKLLTTPRGQGWAMALILIVLALLAIVVLGAVWLTRHRGPKVSQQDLVRDSIENFDAAVQNGDLATLRSITCGSFRDRYVDYDEQKWDDTYRKVAAAQQFPMVASIDEVVVNGDHAEANVTAYMASAPDVQSPRSFDLQFRDNQWKICQSAAQ
jgi:hypothetical protein